MVMPEDVSDLNVVTTKLSEFLHLSPPDIARAIKNSDRPPFQAVAIKRDITWEELSLVKTHRLDLPGMEIGIEPIRKYPGGNVAAHILGYVGEIDKGELSQSRDYKMGDCVGKYGVERTWERYLRGVDGGRQVEVDAVGKELRVLKEVPPIPGHNLILTIDLDLQRYGEKLLGEHAGAIIAMDPASGEILAFCSRPTFLPALFAKGKTTIRNVAHLRYKESNRLRDAALEWKRLGGLVDVLGDGLVVHGWATLSGAVIDPHNDHRLAMSAAIIGLKVPGITIKDEHCVNKSFPVFWDLWDAL